ncbi:MULTISPECIES: DUF4149 domain-containing protein [Ramlibacter]|uniref:DUF4149 domain-containing protein n=1 Tax=Ramlibacter pinisoli TaxID=2682844 RepID=A0A6N8IX69_9BURK|nr:MULTISPECIES: DUF4149 domain-containing protein [Ramlibacter]MBA2961298.1 DUF4149 domain-containing protein [Ramlibacter sp. CGMCC 1.13660]MVQ31242.1 DUF4149 domain-containing protein [Ramlibacter pinisoli]
MSTWRHRLPVLAAALWWGSLSAIGFLAVPLLFANLPTPALAGQTAARLFSAQTWVSLGCGVVVLMASRQRGEAPRMDWARGALGFTLAGLLLALLAEFAVAPRIVARENLRLWHGAGTAMFALQWACALVVLWKATGEAGRAGVSPGDPS